MITDLHLVNVRSLKQVDVKLKPLTVLVGANDTGKSTFLSALHTLAERQVPSHSFWSKPEDVAAYGTVGGQMFNVTHREVRFPHTLRGTCIFQLPAGGVSLEGPGFSDAQGVPKVGPRGEHVAGLLDYLFRHQNPTFQKFKGALIARVPGVQDVQIATPTAATRRVDLVIERGLRMSADGASTGVRSLIFFLALAHHPTPPPLVLIEEPETGLHPKRLEDVIGLLRAITRGEHGTASQVVLSTHSPYLLDCVNLAHDQVLVFRRKVDGSRTAEAADEERLKLFLDEFKLGEVWFTRGEAGLVKKDS